MVASELAMITEDELQAMWEAWGRGESRCPYCIDDEDFHAFCDCWYHEKVCDIPGCMGK